MEGRFKVGDVVEITSITPQDFHHHIAYYYSAEYFDGMHKLIGTLCEVIGVHNVCIDIDNNWTIAYDLKVNFPANANINTLLFFNSFLIPQDALKSVNTDLPTIF